MKALTCFAVMLTFIYVGLASADYHNPPGWDDDPYFTHQSWEFDTDQALNLEPDGSLLNEFGTPEFDIWGDDVNWREEISGKLGVWVMRDGAAYIDVHVPNEMNRELYKEVWLQMVIKSSIAEVDLLSMLTSADVELSSAAYEVELIDYTYERIVPDERWYYYTAMYQIEPQPDYETFHFEFEISEGDYIKIDELDVDTHCIPEPVSVAFSALAFCLLAFRKRAR